MSADEAKAYIDAVNQKVVQRWRERVTEGAFMKKFLEGTLPMRWSFANEHFESRVPCFNSKPETRNPKLVK